MDPLTPHDRVEITRASETVLPVTAPWRQTRGHLDRHEWARLATFIPIRTTTPATTLAREGRRHPATHTGPVRARRPMTSDRRQLSAGMTATLSAELEGRVPHDLVAEIVRAVLDEGRRDAQDRAVESTMVEVRQRLERFIRARSSR
jgi:hypothetical protein